jgi:hypothetical protein
MQLFPAQKNASIQRSISVLIYMSLPTFPIMKRNGNCGGAVRGAKKAVTTTESDGDAVFTNHYGEDDASCALNVGSTVAIADNNSSVETKMSPAGDAPSGSIIISSASKLPASPRSNRERFMANCQPLQVSCDLATVGLHNSSVRFSFTAVVLIVYPDTKGPDRRHIQLIDKRGSTGITVWNENVRLFSSSSVGQVVRFTKLSITFNNGKKGLSMSKESTITFLNSTTVPTDESKWWKSKLLENHLRIIDVHDCNDDEVINVAGIVGMLSTERKRVRDQDKDLLCIRLTDRTGFIDIRSWSHSEHEFSDFLEQPLLLQRVRVTSFAGIKTLELLSGSGTVLKDDFNGKDDLQLYWAE